VGLFDPALAYVALGHLHLPQAIGGDDTRRYSGSPLPMSFSEINYPHQVVLVELSGERVASTRAIPVPRTVELLRVPAQPQPLAQVLEALSALPHAPTTSQTEQSTPMPATAGQGGEAIGTAVAETDPSLWPYLQVRVQLTQPEPGLRGQIEAALAGKAVRLVRIETSMAAPAGRERAPALSLDDLDKLSPSAFFGQLYQHRFHTPPPDDLLAAFHELANAAPTESLLS
jgi:exonuclease SbcD